MASLILGAIVSGISVAIIRRPVAASVVATLVIIGLSGTNGLGLILILVLVWVIRVRWQVMHRRPAPTMSWRTVVGLASALLIAGLVAAAMAHGYDPRDWMGRSSTASSGRLPSIYVLLLDGYPSDTTLREIFGVDNEPFLSSLGALGFVVDRESRSTHTATELTLLGMLSGRSELTESDLFGASGLPGIREVRRELRSAPASAALRGAGYELVTLTSPIDPVTLEFWDRVVSGGHLSDFEIAILGESLVGPLLGDVIMNDLRTRVVDELRDLPDLADPSIQRVVFAHLMAPHPPFLWEQEGQGAKAPACWPHSCHLFTPAMEHLHIPQDEYVRQMRPQVAHLNALVEISVHSLVERDPTGIVVVLSDHGSRYSDLNPKEHFQNLFAIRSPAQLDPGSHLTLDDLFVDLLSLAKSAPAR